MSQKNGALIRAAVNTSKLGLNSLIGLSELLFRCPDCSHLRGRLRALPVGLSSVRQEQGPVAEILFFSVCQTMNTSRNMLMVKYIAVRHFFRYAAFMSFVFAVCVCVCVRERERERECVCVVQIVTYHVHACECVESILDLEAVTACTSIHVPYIVNVGAKFSPIPISSRNHLLAASCPSVSLYKRGCHWTDFYEILS